MEILLCFAVLLLCIIGVCEIIHTVQLCLYKTKGDDFKIMFCRLNGKYAELNLRYVIEQYNWLGRKYADRIIAINEIDSKDVYNRCSRLAEENNIQLISTNEICDLIDWEK